MRYAHAARMGNDLMTRLAAIERERDRWHGALTDPELAAKARLELNEIDHLRPRIERSARTWVDRARALELVVAACLAEAALASPAFETPATAGIYGAVDGCSRSDASTT